MRDLIGSGTLLSTKNFVLLPMVTDHRIRIAYGKINSSISVGIIEWVFSVSLFVMLLLLLLFYKSTGFVFGLSFSFSSIQ